MRKLRKIGKMNHYNDGSRSLFESIVNYDVLLALRQLIARNDVTDTLLIGGLAVSYHAKPRFSNDIDILVLDKRNRQYKYFKNNLYKRKNITLDVYDIGDLGITQEHFNFLKQTEIFSNGMPIPSPTGLMSLYLKNFTLKNKVDAEMLIQNCSFQSKDIKRLTSKEEFIAYGEFLKEIRAMSARGRFPSG